MPRIQWLQKVRNNMQNAPDFEMFSTIWNASIRAFHLISLTSGACFQQIRLRLLRFDAPQVIGFPPLLALQAVKPTNHRPPATGH
jgi:hypothetical protein